MLVLVTYDAPTALFDALRRAAPDVRVERASRELLPDAVAVVGSLSDDDAKLATSLRFLQLTSVGAGRHLERLPPGVAIASARGVFGHVVAEQAIALLLALTRGVVVSVRQMHDHAWKQPGPVVSLRGLTVGLLGVGDIGTHAATRLRAFGTRNVGIARTTSRPLPEGMDELRSIAELDAVLPALDVLLSSVPDTPETRRLLDARRLALLKPTAYFVNVGRGSVVDEAALIESLRTGRLAGAGLDVFDREPLPADSPLWDLPNCVVTAHYGGAPGDEPAFTELAADNLARFLDGREIRNIVSRGRGY